MHVKKCLEQLIEDNDSKKMTLPANKEELFQVLKPHATKLCPDVIDQLIQKVWLSIKSEAELLSGKLSKNESNTDDVNFKMKKKL